MAKRKKEEAALPEVQENEVSSSVPVFDDDNARLRNTNYYVTENGELAYKRKDETLEAFANFVPYVEEIQTIHDGVNSEEKILIKTVRKGYEVQTKPMTKKEVMNNTVESFEAGCMAFLVRGARSHIAQCILQQCVNNRLRKDIYAHTGFTWIRGKLVYLNVGYSISAEGLTNIYNVDLGDAKSGYGFCPEKDDNRYETFVKLLPLPDSNNRLAPDNVLLPLLAYTFLSPLNEMMREKSYEPRFLLYLIGRTGTFKTTLANLFLCFFGQFNRATIPMGFRDTANAIERKLAMYADALTLVDDKFPPSTLDEKKRMAENEQALARMLGDRGSRGRLNADTSLKAGYVAKGNAIVTAEDAFGNIGESGIARSVSIELKSGDVDTKILTYMQQHSLHLNQVMSEYIQYIITNHDKLKEVTGERFVNLRERARNELPGQHARLAEAIAQLQIGIDVLTLWFRTVYPLSEDDSRKFRRESWECFKNIAVEQNKRLKDEKPTVLFINAIKDIYLRNPDVLRTLKDEKGFSNGQCNSFIGYHDTKERYIYLTGDAFNEVLKYYKAQNREFPLSETALSKHLKDEKLSICDRGRNKFTKKVNGTNMKCWKLPDSLIFDEKGDEDKLEEGGDE